MNEYLAWLEAPKMRDRPERVFFAKGSSQGPRTSVTELIQGIYEADPEMARKIVRSRIYTTQPELSSTCQGMIAIAAKRATANLTAPDLTHATQVRAPSAQGFSLSNEPFHKDLLRVPRDESLPLPLRDRAVEALLVVEGQVLARAKNTNAKNRTLHAELNLVRGWSEAHGAWPKDAEIYVTLEPCRMCAAQILSLGSKPRGVFYLEPEPGSAARGSLLQGIAQRLS